MTSYKYSIKDDTLNSSVCSDSLSSEISSGITSPPTLDRIDTYSDDLTIWFTESLTSQQKDTLNNIVNLHTGQPLADDGKVNSTIYGQDRSANIICFTDGTNPYMQSKDERWKILSYLPFVGTLYIGIPLKIKLVAWLFNNRNSSYSFRIIREDNAKEICKVEKLTNEKPKIIDMGTLSNLPENQTILQIQGKLTRFIPYSIFDKYNTYVRVASMIIQ